MGLPPYQDGGREQYMLATGQLRATTSVGGHVMPETLTRHWEAVKQALLSRCNWADRPPVRWSCANAGAFRSKRRGATPGHRRLRTMPDPLGVGSLIDCRWERLSPDAWGREVWRGVSTYTGAFVLASWKGPAYSYGESSLEPNYSLWMTPDCDIFVLNAVEVFDDIDIPTTGQGNGELYAGLWILLPRPLSDVSWSDWVDLTELMKTNDMYSGPWSVLESMAHFAGIRLDPSGNRAVLDGDPPRRQALPGETTRPSDRAKDLVPQFLTAMRAVGNPGAHPVIGTTRYRVVIGSRSFIEFTGWVLVRHRPWADSDRRHIVLTTDGAWRLAHKGPDGSLTAVPDAPDLGSRWVDIGEALQDISKREDVPLGEP